MEIEATVTIKNHFIELDVDQSGQVWLVIHSGSRNFGLKVCNYYQKLAKTVIRKDKLQDEIKKIKAEKKGKEIELAIIDLRKRLQIGVPSGLEYLEGKNSEDYLRAMKFINVYGKINRRIMSYAICKFLGVDFWRSQIIESVHNYIDLESNPPIIRKGAISARDGELALIPLNMADGIILARGKGNPDWNYSAPHGAGRLMSRKYAKLNISMEDYRRVMKEKGVWTSCVSTATLDEAPMAYKDKEDIIRAIEPTAEMLEVWRSVYNFKAGEEDEHVQKEDYNQIN